jgi:NADPH-dependent curcumin reductase CurA
MTELTNRRVILKTRPVGVPLASHFELDEQPVPELREGQFLVANRFLSVDPAMRGWTNDTPTICRRWPLAMSCVRSRLETSLPPAIPIGR